MIKYITKIQKSFYLGILIITSSFYARPLYRYILKIIPRDLVTVLTFASIIFVGAILIKFNASNKNLISNFIYKKNYLRKKLFCFLSLLLAVVFLFSILKLPEERIHIFLYLLLGVIRVREVLLSINNPIQMTRKNYLLIILKAFFTVFIVSSCAEILQSTIPERVGDPYDVLLDTTSGLIGIIFYLLLKC